MKTTNELLAETMQQIDQLIAWAEADAQHSLESDAADQGKDDKQRAYLLRQARATLQQCRK